MSASTKFGPFFLDVRLAVGGTAEVYLARPQVPDPSLPERLIVKRLLPHYAADPQGRSMFEREAKLHGQILHDNVVEVFHAGADASGEPYLAMEFVDGVDLYRLLRRLRQDGDRLPVDVSIYLACAVLRALENVHSAADQNGAALGILHRDVSPSNVYLRLDGHVKLGDFGIAQSLKKTGLRSEHGQMIKGKFAYLSPEQVSGEEYDQRADLFSLAVMLAEMLLGKALFSGAGQLAVLLAIRDCRIDLLDEVRDRAPEPLLDVLRRALARDPKNRFPSAKELRLALAVFCPDQAAAKEELSKLVFRAQAKTSSREMAAVRAPEEKPEDVPPDEAKTGEYGLQPSFVETEAGKRLGPWPFAKLVEAIATATVGRGDKVSYMGGAPRSIEDIEDLARFLPATTATTNQVVGPGSPDFHDDLSTSATSGMLDILIRILGEKETGVLFAEREPRGKPGNRKELYFQNGRLHHVASTNASELLGEYLVRKGKLAREELDLGLAVLPRYGGRMGDTLISLGLVSPVDIFRAIREQGRDRVADLFTWKQGTVSFYRGHDAPHVEFPLDLDLPSLMLAGLEALRPDDTALARYDADLDKLIVEGPDDELFPLSGTAWPPLVARVLVLGRTGRTLRDILRITVRAGHTTSGEVLRAIELLLATKLLNWTAP